MAERENGLLDWRMTKQKSPSLNGNGRKRETNGWGGEKLARNRVRCVPISRNFRIMAITRDNSRNLLCLQYVGMFLRYEWFRSQIPDRNKNIWVIHTQLHALPICLLGIRYQYLSDTHWLHLFNSKLCFFFFYTMKTNRWKLYRKMQHISPPFQNSPFNTSFPSRSEAYFP